LYWASSSLLCASGARPVPDRSQRAAPQQVAAVFLVAVHAQGAVDEHVREAAEDAGRRRPEPVLGGQHGGQVGRAPHGGCLPVEDPFQGAARGRQVGVGAAEPVGACRRRLNRGSLADCGSSHSDTRLIFSGRSGHAAKAAQVLPVRAGLPQPAGPARMAVSPTGHRHRVRLVLGPGGLGGDVE
jgi:hypothetical protein